MFPSLDIFCRHYNLPLFRKGDWRLCEPKQGEVEGIPTSRGTVIATDGIQCYIVRGDDSLFLGHIAHFIPDKEEQDGGGKPPKQPKHSAMFTALLE